MGLRDRLRAKARPVVRHPLVVKDQAGPRAALADADRALLAARVDHDEDSPEVAEAQRAVEEAQRKVDACVEMLTLRALPPEDFEALVAAHPPQDDEDTWHTATFRPALLAACVEGDMTEDDWAEFEPRCSTGERNALFFAALAVNSRVPDVSVPKG